MAIIKSKDVLEVEQITKDLKKVRDEVDLLTKSNDKLSTSLQKVKKSNDGTEAKKLATQTDRLNKSTLKLKDTLTAEDAVKKQLLRANAKLSESRTKAAKDLALVRQKTLQQNKALREQAKANLGVAKSNNGLISSFKNLGKQLFGALGITAGVGLLVSQFKKASDRMLILVRSAKRLEGVFDITERQAKKLAAQINAMATNIEGVDGKGLEVALIAVAKTFDDLSEQDALDLIREGFQKGSDNSGEFLDILREYPGFFKKAGLSASQMFAIINQQVKEGVYSDKGVDAIKEATISLTENTQIVKDALRPLGESINLQIRQKVEAGKAFEAMQLISSEMVTLGVNSAEAQTIMADVFKGAGEDSDAFIRNLHNIELSLEGVTKQTNVYDDSIINLSTSYNNFLLSVESGNGFFATQAANISNYVASIFDTLTVFSETNLTNKLKQIANGFLNLTEKAVLPFLSVLESLGIEIPKFRFEIENTAESTDEYTKELDKNTKALIEEDTEIKKLTKSQSNQNKVLKETIKIRTDLIKLADRQATELETSDIDDRLAAELDAIDKLQAREDEKVIVGDKIKEDELAKIQDWEDAANAIKEQAFTSGQQLASDIFSSFQDERLAESRANADAEIAILQDRLDKGVISEEQFTKEVAAIEKKERIKSAKAEKKKALFDVAIATAVGIIKALAALRPGLAVAIGIAGGIQAAAIAAKPIPKFAKGGEIGGQTHENGGTLIEGEKGEFVVKEKAYSNSKEITNMVNDGLISDKNLPQLNNQDNNMMLAGLLMSGNKHTEDLVTLMGNMGWTYDRNGERVINKADGSLIEKFNV